MTGTAVKLTPKQRMFVKEYLVDLNATQAAIRAGYSEKTATVIAVENLAKPYIAAAIQAEMDKRADSTGITAEKVLKEIWNIASTDAGELVEHKVGCCRHCWGVDFKYQRTPNEYDQALEAFRAAHHAWVKAPQAFRNTNPEPVFNEAGGIGFNATRAPNPECPECFGEGVGRVIIKDTSNVPSHVKSLFAGVKQTQNGIEIKMHPKDRALEMLGRHLKLFTDQVKHTGDVNNPVALLLQQIPAASSFQPIADDEDPDS
jgi:hypothetical protein